MQVTSALEVVQLGTQRVPEMSWQDGLLAHEAWVSSEHVFEQELETVFHVQLGEVTQESLSEFTEHGFWHELLTHWQPLTAVQDCWDVGVQRLVTQVACAAFQRHTVLFGKTPVSCSARCKGPSIGRQ